VNSLSSRMQTKWLAVLAPAALFVSMASHADVATPTVTVTYPYDSLQEMWRRATNNVPVSAAAIAFLADKTKVVETTSAADPVPQVVELGEEEPPPSSNAPAVSRKLLPIASLDVTLSRDVHHRVALLERLVAAFRDYRDPLADANRANDVKVLGNTAHLELFVAHALVYLEAESREQKCASYSRAKEHASYLGWTDTSSTPPPVTVRAGWESTSSAARSYYGASFTRQIPANLCDLPIVKTRAEVENALKAQVDGRILAEAQRQVQDTVGKLGPHREAYARALDKSNLDLPTAKILALRKAVEDSSSLHAFVTDDTLMLEAGRGTTKSFLTRLTEQAAAMRASAQTETANGGALDQTSADATAKIDAYNRTLADVVTTLKSIAATPGLDAATRASLDVCNAIPGSLTSDNFPAYAASLDRCITAVAGALSALKDRSGSHPSFTPFIQKVTALSQAHIALLNAP